MCRSLLLLLLLCVATCHCTPAATVSHYALADITCSSPTFTTQVAASDGSCSAQVGFPLPVRLLCGADSLFVLYTTCNSTNAAPYVGLSGQCTGALYQATPVRVLCNDAIRTLSTSSHVVTMLLAAVTLTMMSMMA